MTATSWLSFREFNGLLVYFTHLMSYRCAIREARIGIDTIVPDRVLKMPPCDTKQPNEVPSSAQLYMKLFTGFMPGGDTPGNMEAARRALILIQPMHELGKIRGKTETGRLAIDAAHRPLSSSGMPWQVAS